jgi:hypothetical protein
LEIPRNWSQLPDLNRRPTLYESVALPTELNWPEKELERSPERASVARKFPGAPRVASHPDFLGAREPGNRKKRAERNDRVARV